jgi:hypothetical protein
MANRDAEDLGVEYVLELERAAGREPRDTRKTGDPVDIVSPPRLIEVKAYGGSARGQPIPLEQRQVDALHANPDNFFLYIVDGIDRARDGLGEPQVLLLHGATIAAMVDRTRPTITYWPTLRVAEYDSAPRITPAKAPEAAPGTHAGDQR